MQIKNAARTHVLMAAISEPNLIRVQLATKVSRHVAYRCAAEIAESPDAKANNILTTVRHSDGQIYHWYGGPKGNWRSHTQPIEVEIAAAMACGTLDFSSLKEEGDSVTGQLPIRAEWIDGESQTVFSNQPGLTKQLLQRASDQVVKTLLATLQHTGNETAIEEAFNLRQEYEFTFWDHAVLRLLTPAAQWLPDGMAATAGLAKACIMPYARATTHTGFASNGVPLDVFGIRADGSLGGVRYQDTVDLQLLPLVLRNIASSDRAVIAVPFSRASFHPRFGEWIRGEKDGEPPGVASSLRKFERWRYLQIGRQLGEHIPDVIKQKVEVVADWNTLVASGHAIASRNRTQTADSIWGAIDFLHEKSIQDVVDQGDRLIPVMAKTLKTKPWVVRAFATTDHGVLSELGTSVQFGTRGVAQVVHALGPNGVPKSSQHVRAIIAGLNCLNHNDVTTYLRKVTADSILWSAGVVGRTISKRGWEAVQELTQDRNAAQDLYDYLRAISSLQLRAVRPFLYEDFDLQPAEHRKCRHLLFSEATLEDMLRWSARYHHVVANTPILSSTGSALGALPVIDTVRLPKSDYQVKQLVTQQDLAGEGRRQQHCVATYGGEVVDYRSAIFSLTPNADGDAITVEMRFDGKSWHLAQARGYMNAAVVHGEPAHAALTEWLEHLESVTPEIPPERLSLYADGNRRRQARLATDPLSLIFETHGTNAWKRFRHCLPGSAHGRIENRLLENFERAFPRNGIRARLLKHLETEQLTQEVLRTYHAAMNLRNR